MNAPMRLAVALILPCSIAAAACSNHAAVPAVAAGVASTAGNAHFGASAGTLYVASSASKVYAFDPGTTTPKLTITVGIHTPTDLIFDSNENLYVANLSPGHGSVTEYANGQGAPIRTIVKGISGINSGGMAVTNDGTLIVTDQGGVSEYHPGATTPFLTIARPAAYVALASQTTFFATMRTSAVSNFTVGTRKPNFVISRPFMVPGPIAVDSSGTLYVVDVCGPGCAVYTYDSTGKLIATLSNGIDAPVGVLVDSQDNAWIDNFGEFNSSITAFHAGQVSPFEYIANSVNSPDAMVVDAAGTLYIGNGRGGHDIVEYASGQTTPTLKFALPHNQSATSMVIAPPGL
jgi:sugar lactone lactonase YvrE